MSLKPGMSWKQLQKQEAAAPAVVQMPDVSGTTQVQQDPTRQAAIMEANSKAASFRQRLNEIRSQMKASVPQIKDEK